MAITIKLMVINMKINYLKHKTINFLKREVIDYFNRNLIVYGILMQYLWNLMGFVCSSARQFCFGYSILFSDYE